MESIGKLTEPPETDLDYYARPENYTGSNLSTLTRFLVAKEKKEGKVKKLSKKKTKHINEERQLYKRYRHILPVDFYDPSSSSTASTSEDEQEKEQSTENQTRNGREAHEKISKLKDSPVDEATTGNDDEEDSRLSNILSNGSDQTESETESGYESRLRSQEEKFRNSPQIHSHSVIRDKTKSEAWPPPDDLAQDLTLPGEFSAKEHKTPRDSVASLTSVMSTNKTRTGSIAGLAGVAKLLSWRGSLQAYSYDIRRKLQLERFRKLTVGIVNVLKLAKAIIKPTDSPSALLKNFTAMAKQPEKKEDASDNMKNYGLEFNASYFRANREISISSEVKNFLRQPPTGRTPEQIQTIIFGLQSLPSFAEYPLHMQEKLARVAWYEIVTPMRTIIRQGHFAENFYFILSGQALVTIHKPGDVTPKTAGMMRRGTSFGELALLHHSRRTATVTSHDTVQLLSVGREDFFDIFMAGHGSEQMPEHIKFISQLDFMKDWPLERLLERPDQCLLHFFKRNMVILKASEVSEWFYVVKSGTCQVLKQLKGVTGRLGQLTSSRHVSHDMDGKLRSGASFQDSRINTGRRLTKKNVKANSIIEQVRVHNHSESSHNTGRLQPFSEEEGGEEEHKDTNHRASNGVQRMGNKRHPQPGQSFSKLSIGPPHFRSMKSMDSESKEKRKHRNNSSFSYHRRQRREQQQQKEQQQKQQQQQQHEASPVFVQIELLKPRDVFGLDMVNFNSVDFQRSTVSLVSLGAECIMLSKAFFLKHANDRVKKRFSEIVQPYPDERSLQASLQNKADWELYKHSLLSAITAPKPTGMRGAPLTSHH